MSVEHQPFIPLDGLEKGEKAMSYSLPPALRRRAQRGLGIPLFGLLALLLIPLLASSLPAATWFRFRVDPISAKGTGVALDPQHRPHVFYYSPNQFTAVMYHSFWTGSSWQKEVVDSAASYHNDGPSAAIDSSGRIHVAYFNRQYHLGYALYDGVWHLETADTATKTGDWCELSLDSNNDPCIAYSQSNTWRTRYASKSGSAWQIYELAGGGGYGANFDLDAQGHSHISDSYSTIRYSYYDGSSWHYEAAASSGSQYNSLTLDNQGRPQISYYSGADPNFDLKFATKNSGAWQSYTVDHGLQQYKRGWDNHILCDPSGGLHIAYFAHNEGHIKHAWGSGGTWSTEVVDTVGGAVIPTRGTEVDD